MIMINSDYCTGYTVFGHAEHQNFIDLVVVWAFIEPQQYCYL